jgi:predicted enzyme related to lactoylglutathione lyase
MLNPTGIAWVGLFAADLPKLSDFYERTVGLRVVGRSDGVCVFDAGAGSLFEIWGDGYASKTGKTPREQSMQVGFLVERLESAIASLSAQGLEPDTEIDSDLGTRWIPYTDPEGNRFELKDLHG